jgi:hypothetical protein
MSKPITGRAIIRIDGAVIPSENGATLNPGGVNRVAERHGGVTYFREEEIVPTVECQVNHTADVDILALSNIVGATVMFEANTGRKYLLSGAFTTEPTPLDTAAGKARLMLAANSCVEV